MMEEGWSADNIAFGSGGALLQKLNRDTQNFAFKCCAIKRNGDIQDVSKNPVDGAWKASKAGMLELIRKACGSFDTVTHGNYGPGDTFMLETVYENGELVREHKWEDIQKNVEATQAPWIKHIETADNELNLAIDSNFSRTLIGV